LTKLVDAREISLNAALDGLIAAQVEMKIFWEENNSIPDVFTSPKKLQTLYEQLEELDYAVHRLIRAIPMRAGP
jgi:hypothetical protein